MSPRSWSLPAALALIAALFVGVAVPAAFGAGERRTERQLHQGVRHVVIDQDDPDVMVNVARVARDAEVDVRVVTANDQIAGGPGGGLELTSEMCRRAGGLLCVNADFAECPTCGQPIGGVVKGARVLRSFHSAHDQFSVIGPGSFSTDRPSWSGRLVATYTWPNEPTRRQELLGEDPGERTETRTLGLDALNRHRPDGATVLFTPEWAPTTRTEGGFEAVLGTTEGVRPGSMPVTWRGGASGDSPIPIDGVVVSAAGGEEAGARAFFDEWRSSDAPRRALHLETALTQAAMASVGAHPVLLRGGVPQPLNNDDTKVVRRHPRTLAGWTSEGELLLVTVDGRQPGHSQGMTLYEATDLMVRLGAIDAVNLDGGGSSTFVGPCPTGTCVLNRPSDDHERRVTTALAIVARGPVVQAAAAAPSPPPPPVAPPPPSAPVVVEPTVPDTSAETAAADATATPPVVAEPGPLEPTDGDQAGDGASGQASGGVAAVLPEFPRSFPAPAPTQPASSPLRPLSGLAVVGVLANVAAMGWCQRRRLLPVMAAAVSDPRWRP